MKRLVLLFCLLPACLGFISHEASAQDYLTATGNPSFAVNIPVENGFINIANGNLHLEFPLATHKQRGALSLNESLVYDSRIWMIGHYSNYYWWPNNVPNTPNTQGGWRYVTGAETGTISPIVFINSQGYCEFQTGSQYYNYTDYFTWADASGTSHTFDAPWSESHSDCNPSPSEQTASGYATDASGYSIQLSGSNDQTPSSIVVRDSNGTQVYPQVIDRYGNSWSADAAGNLVDDVGRTPVIVTQSGNITYYDVLAPNGPIANQGTRVRYTVTTAPISVSTHFNQSGVRECPDGTSGVLYPVQSIQLPNGTSYSFTYDSYGELSTVTLPTGGVITYGWTNFQDSYQNQNRWLTSRTVGSDPATTFTPSVLSQCASNGTGCQEQVTLHRPGGDEIVYQLTLNNGAWNTNISAYTGSATAGQPALATTANTYDYGHPFNSIICTGAQYITKSNALITLAGGLQSQTQYVYNDPQVGKVNAVKEWDYYSGSPSALPTRETDYTYTGLDVHEVTIKDGAGDIAGKTTYGYTTSATSTSGVAQHGTQNAGGPYLQTVSHWLNTGGSSTTTYTMYDTGQIAAVQDANQSPTTTFTYQCQGSLPLTVTDPLGYVTTYGYDCNSGAVTSVADPNDAAAGRSGTTYAYESAAGRPYTVTAPDGGVTTYTYPSSTTVETAITATPDPTITSADIVDSFGRPYQHSSGGISTEITYDTNGRKYSVTNPHTSGSNTTDGTTYILSYDGLDRPLTQQNPDSSTVSFAYSANTVTATDERNIAWTRTLDVFGHLKSVSEPGLPSSSATTYVYDGLGNIQTITQPGVSSNGESARVRTFTYDSMARLICASHPESAQNTCPASAAASLPTGVMSYSYDSVGNVRTKTDARGVVTTFYYDVLSRLTHAQSGGGSGIPGFSYSYFYDSGAQFGFTGSNTIGRLVLDSNYVNAGSHYSYDPVGRLIYRDACTPSNCTAGANPVTAQYDMAGNMTDLTYPDGRHIKQSWDGSARLTSSIFSDWNGQPVNAPYVSSLSYLPNGGTSQMVLGNGVTQSYSANNRFMPCEIKVDFPSSPGGSTTQTILDKQYFYSGTNNALCGTPPGNNGAITGIVDALNAGKSQTFQYDSLVRLSSASRADGGYNYSYPTDSFGNMTQVNNLTGNPAVTILSNNQLQLGGNAYTYDLAGNLIDTGQPMYGGHHFTFDAAGQLTQLDQGASATYTFNPSGQRVRKDVGNDWTEYVSFNGLLLAEKHADGSWSDNIYAGGSRIARADSYDVRLHLSGTNCANCGYQNWAYTIPIGAFTIQSGDKVAWRQYQNGPAVPRGGLAIQFTDGTVTNWQTTDQDGMLMNDDRTQGAWHFRVADLRQYAGKTILRGWINEDVNSGAGAWDEWFSDISFYRADGTVQPIYNRLDSVSYPSFGTSGVSNQNFSVDRSNSAGDAENVAGTTTYFVADHLGTARLAFAGGGWPVWSGEFAPFGQEINAQATPDHYKFTGLERDSETGLDHTQYRQYSSNMGRWNSTDPYGGSMDLSNPQSLNRYAYVGNNPLGYTDPLGLEGGSSNPVGGCLGAVITSGTNVGADASCVAGFVYNWISGFLGTLGGPSFHGTTQPRPNAQIWDEHGGFHASPYSSIASMIGDVDGITTPGCEFGSCSSGFSQGSGSSSPSYDETKIFLRVTVDLNLFFLKRQLQEFARQWPVNGTALPYSGPQDGVCSTGPFAGAMNANPAILKCCQAHDSCYTRYNCNATSWLPGGIPGACKTVCNATAVACIGTAK